MRYHQASLNEAIILCDRNLIEKQFLKLKTYFSTASPPALRDQAPVTDEESVVVPSRRYAINHYARSICP